MSPEVIATIILGLTSLGGGLGWLRSWELRKIGEKQAEANVESTRVTTAEAQVRTEVQALTLYKDTLVALEASNRATLEANHYSDEMRAECANLREAQSKMRTQLEECIAARATGAANVARLTQQQVESKGEIAALRAELAALTSQVNGTV